MLDVRNMSAVQAENEMLKKRVAKLELKLVPRSQKQKSVCNCWHIVEERNEAYACFAAIMLFVVPITLLTLYFDAEYIWMVLSWLIGVPALGIMGFINANCNEHYRDCKYVKSKVGTGTFKTTTGISTFSGQSKGHKWFNDLDQKTRDSIVIELQERKTMPIKEYLKTITKK